MHINRLMTRWRSLAWREAKRLKATRINQTKRLALLEQIRKLQEEIASLRKQSHSLTSRMEDIGECVYLCPHMNVFVLNLCFCIPVLQHGRKRSQKTEAKTQEDKTSE